MIGWTVRDSDDDDARSEEQATVIRFQAAPEAVQSAFTQYAHGAAASRVERVVKDGITVFELEYPLNGGTASMTLAPAGQPLEMESPVSVNDLPAALRDAMAKHHPDGKIESAELVQTFAYELHINAGGKTREVAALATGQMKGRHRHEEARRGGDDDDWHGDRDRNEDEDDD